MAADRHLLAHLFRRAAFGARPEELAYYEQRGYTAAVEDLLAPRPLMGRTAMPVAETPSRLAPHLPELQAEWVDRMIRTDTPLVERMALFLHDHFATAHMPMAMIETPELAEQLRTFRTHALGSWSMLVHTMIEDVALGVYLDHHRSVSGRSNENLARELMELFLLGPGTHTERDVRELARALTGYTLESNPSPTGPRRRLVFAANRHDRTLKTILGRQGPWLPHDAVDILLATPAASTHLATRLVATFVNPVPPAALVDRVAGVLRTSGWSIKAALRTIFLSLDFMDPANRHTILRSPVEAMVAAQRALGRRDAGPLTNVWAAKAGQSLFKPPNVGGWPANEGWLQAAYVLARYNAAAAFAEAHVRSPAQTIPPTSTPSATTQAWAAVFGMTELHPAMRSAVEQYLSSSTTTLPMTKEAGVITLLLSSPDFAVA